MTIYIHILNKSCISQHNNQQTSRISIICNQLLECGKSVIVNKKKKEEKKNNVIYHIITSNGKKCENNTTEHHEYFT